MNKEELIKYLDEEIEHLIWLGKLPYNPLTEKGWTRLHTRQGDFREFKTLIEVMK